MPRSTVEPVLIEKGSMHAFFFLYGQNGWEPMRSAPSRSQNVATYFCHFLTSFQIKIDTYFICSKNADGLYFLMLLFWNLRGLERNKNLHNKITSYNYHKKIQIYIKFRLDLFQSIFFADLLFDFQCLDSFSWD